MITEREANVRNLELQNFWRTTIQRTKLQYQRRTLNLDPHHRFCPARSRKAWLICPLMPLSGEEISNGVRKWMRKSPGIFVSVIDVPSMSSALTCCCVPKYTYFEPNWTNLGPDMLVGEVWSAKFAALFRVPLRTAGWVLFREPQSRNKLRSWKRPVCWF